MANVVDALRVYVGDTDPDARHRHNAWYHHEMCLLRASLLERRRALNDNNDCGTEASESDGSATTVHTPRPSPPG